MALVEGIASPGGVKPLVGLGLRAGDVWPAMAEEGVGDRLRRYRRLRKLSQGKLAELAGVPRTYIADLERGAILIPREPENLKALARILGVRLSELAQATGWYEEEGTPADKEQAAIEAILTSDLPEDRKQAGLIVIRDLFAASRRDRTG